MIYYDKISLIADIISIVSAILTIVSAISIKKYYKKIVRQYSVEKLILSEQYIHSAISKLQHLKRIYLANKRGLSENKLSELYLDIEECLNNIIFNIPTTYKTINKCLLDAKENIKVATQKNNILKKKYSF